MELDETLMQLAETREISDQAQFLALLAERGFVLTQPTLSRHLRRLSLRKRGGRYRWIEDAGAAVGSFSIAVSPPNLLVLRTQPGYAQALAVHLDAVMIPELAGTLAGDDTIFIAVTSDLAEAEAAVRRVLAERPL